MNKKTIALTRDQYQLIIETIYQGFSGMRPNPRVATALVLEANLGLRIGDILRLHLSDIIQDGSRYRLNIVERKTKKERTFTIPFSIYQYIENYCLRNKIGKDERILPISERTVQSILQMTCSFLGIEGVGTHSFRKFYATEIYKNNGYDIVLVQKLLQHSSVSTTQRYIGMEPSRIEEAILNHLQLL